MAAGAKIGIKVMSMVIAIPVGIVTRKLVDQVWKVARPDEPARKASDQNVRWGDAIIWGALSAAGVVASDLATRRGSAAAFRAITGNQPPPPKTTKAEKKLEKAQEKLAVADGD